MTMPLLTRLHSLEACADAVAFVETCATVEEAWETCQDGHWLAWLVGRAHSSGGLTQQRLVRVILRVIEPVLYLAHGAADHLGVVARWTVGEATIEEVRTAHLALWRIRSDADADAPYAAYASAAAAYAAAAAAYASDAAAYAHSAVRAYSAAAYAAERAMADVVRAAITIDELCAALDVTRGAVR